MTALDRSLPPAPAPLREFRFPAFSCRPGPHGSQLYLRSDPRVPIVTLRLLLRAGAHFDPTPLPGLASFTAALLDEGTRRHSSEQIADRIESLGGSLSTGAAWSTATASASVLSTHLPAALDLLVEIVREPAFAVEEVERIRRDRLAGWLRRRDDADWLADEAVPAVLYAGTPYGHTLFGSREALEAIRAEDLHDFWARHGVAAGAAFLLVGDFDVDEAATMLADRLATLPAGAAPAAPEVRPPEPIRRIRVIDRPDAAQTELRIAQVGPPRTHPDRPLLDVANSLLGGKFTSRINLNLRERNGFTYGAHTAFTDREGPGPFLLWTAVANEAVGAATGEALGELARLCDELVPEEELREAVAYLRGVFPATLQTQAGLLRRLHEIAVFDFAPDYFDHLLRQWGSTTPAALREAVRRHLSPERAAIVAVGPAQRIAPQLEALGEVEVVQAGTPEGERKA